MRSSLDTVTREQVKGWAQDRGLPGARLSLLITVDDELVARVLADEFRADLLKAGIGDGRHAFNVELNGALPLGSHLLAVRREDDGSHLRGSPVLVAAVSRFDEATQDQLARLILEADDNAGLENRLSFLTRQLEAPLRHRASRRTSRADRIGRQGVDSRWVGDEASGGAPARALFIDDTIPVLSRDAGSNAVLSHMAAMRRLGFEVSFAAADMSRDAVGVLDAAGIAVCQPPWYCSVEEVLRRETERFDLVYLHRVTAAARYMELVRHHQPRARVVYSVADLHHLRMERRAVAEQRPELLPLAQRLKVREVLATAAADATITHSPVEAAVLWRLVPSARVHVVPWAVPVRPTTVPFARRHGVGFVAHYPHAPNLDAAGRLINEIMPRVRAASPDIDFVLAGNGMPDWLRVERDGVVVLGQVESLTEVFDRVRLTVAPLAFGAGIKGKVLESLAAGVPCVCSPVAAEGLDLPPILAGLVADGTAATAEAIARLHEDEAFNTACGKAGLDYVAGTLAEGRIDALLREATGSPGSARPGL